MGLLKFILWRMLASVPVMIGVSIITFGLVHLGPTDVVDIIIGLDPDARPADRVRLRAELGLDRPVYVQYIDWITDVMRGDFGEVYSRGPDAQTLIASRWEETVLLGLFGWTFAMLIAIPTGIYAAVRKGKLGDHTSRFVAMFGISIPNFWLGLMLLAILAVQFNLFSAIPPAREPLLSRPMLWWLILPGITIGTAASANLMRIMRTAMVEEMNKEYVTAARAKGLPEWRVVLVHVLRNSLISVTTVAAFLTASIVSGSVVVETVFGWPGLGILFIDAATRMEINLIMAITLLTGLAIIVANLLADIIYAVLDPRIRTEF